LCTPPSTAGTAHPAVLVAAELSGIDTVFKVGGAQAIAALAYGTESLPKVEKIFGPGNVWVTTAKQLVAQDPGGAACDLPAGPSSFRSASRGAGSPGSVTPAQCSSVRGRPSRSATTARAPTTCCRPTAMPAPRAGSPCATF